MQVQFSSFNKIPAKPQPRVMFRSETPAAPAMADHVNKLQQSKLNITSAPELTQLDLLKEVNRNAKAYFLGPVNLVKFALLPAGFVLSVGATMLEILVMGMRANGELGSNLLPKGKIGPDWDLFPQIRAALNDNNRHLEFFKPLESALNSLCEQNYIGRDSFRRDSEWGDETGYYLKPLGKQVLAQAQKQSSLA